MALQEKKFLWSLGSLTVLPWLSTFELFRRPWTQVGVEALLILLLWTRVAPGLGSGERDARGQDQA